MIQSLKLIYNKSIYIFQSRGMKDLLYAIFYRSIAVLKMSILSPKFNIQNKKKWKDVRNKYKGKRVFLIGNGPSLNKTELYLLKNEYTICFNHFDLFFDRINWFPYFYSITDNLVLEDKLNELNKIVEKSKYSFFPGVHFKGTNFTKKIKNENILWINQILGTGFSNNLPCFNGASYNFCRKF